MQTAFSITLDKLSSTEGKDEDDLAIAEVAKTIIKLCALCSPDDIPQDLIQNTVYKHFLDENITLPKNTIWRKAENLLKNFDIIKKKHKSEIIDEKLEKPVKLDDGTTTTRTPFENNYIVYDIHRSLQTVLNTKFGESKKINYIKALMEEFELLLTFELDFDYKHNIKYSAQADILLNSQDILKIDDKNAYDLSFNLAGFYRNTAQFEFAAKCYERSLKISKKINGEEHEKTGTSYNNLALLYKSQGRYEEAEPYYLKTIDNYEKALGKTHPWTATSYNNLALLYYSQGRYEEAEPYYIKSLEICQKLLGEDHPNTAQSYNNLAGLYESQEKNDEAMSFHKKSLKIRRNTLGENHPDVAQSYWWLGTLEYKDNEYQKALELCEKALKIYQNALPENHPTIQNCESWIVDIKEAMEK